MPSAALERIRIGTSGWSYTDWVGPFYPEGTARGRFLSEYAEHFQAVEVDATFYAIPARRTVEGWERSTPDGFRFALKVPSVVTHGSRGERYRVDQVLRDEDRAFDAFVEVLQPLRSKIAMLVFQFPYFRVKEMAREDFIDRLQGRLENLPEGLRFAVEIRNKSWVTDEYLELLRRQRVAAVMIDHPYFPWPRQQLEIGMVTTDFACVRLLGDRYSIEKKTKSWEKVVEDKSRRLKEWSDVILEIASRSGVSAAYAFSNNHFAGHAPETSRELRRLVEAAA